MEAENDENVIVNPSVHFISATEEIEPNDKRIVAINSKPVTEGPNSIEGISVVEEEVPVVQDISVGNMGLEEVLYVDSLVLEELNDKAN